MWKIYFCKLFYITNLFIVSRPTYYKFDEIKKQRLKFGSQTKTVLTKKFDYKERKIEQKTCKENNPPFRRPDKPMVIVEHLPK